MIIPPAIKVNYEVSEPVVAAIGARVHDILSAFCSEKMYPFVGRPKRLNSIAEKIESGRYRCWSELDDLYACTVIIPELTAEAATLDYVKREFDVQSIRERGAALKDPEVFRFDSPRVYARLRPSDTMLVGEAIYKAQFEIQVRTAYEHAWIVATHPLVYKGDEADWKRLRLAAQMKAMVEHLDVLNVSFGTVAAKMPESSWPEVSLRIDVIDQFTRAVQDGRIPREVAPDSWKRFADNFVSLVGATCRRPQMHERGTDALRLVINEVTANYSGPKFLRSLSLMQFVLGVLCEKQFLRATPPKYTPIVTPELLAFFPAASVLTSPFRF